MASLDTLRHRQQEEAEAVVAAAKLLGTVRDPKEARELRDAIVDGVGHAVKNCEIIYSEEGP